MYSYSVPSASPLIDIIFSHGFDDCPCTKPNRDKSRSRIIFKKTSIFILQTISSMTTFSIYVVLCRSQCVAVCIKKASGSIVAAVGYIAVRALSSLVSSEVGAVHLMAVSKGCSGFAELAGETGRARASGLCSVYSTSSSILTGSRCAQSCL